MCIPTTSHMRKTESELSVKCRGWIKTCILDHYAVLPSLEKIQCSLPWNMILQDLPWHLSPDHHPVSYNTELLGVSRACHIVSISLLKLVLQSKCSSTLFPAFSLAYLNSYFRIWLGTQKERMSIFLNLRFLMGVSSSEQNTPLHMLSELSLSGTNS